MILFMIRENKTSYQYTLYTRTVSSHHQSYAESQTGVFYHLQNLGGRLRKWILRTETEQTKISNWHRN